MKSLKRVKADIFPTLINLGMEQINMVWTNVEITKEAQTLLIKAAALQKVSIEELASQILSEGIKEKLFTLKETEPFPSQNNPLADLHPYAYDATPEESAFAADDWNMEHS